MVNDEVNGESTICSTDGTCDAKRGCKIKEWLERSTHARKRRVRSNM
jgi:hypothetical protein